MNRVDSQSTANWSDLPEDILDRIDRQADDFEQSWRRGERPAIEPYLGDATGRYRTALLEELLTIEWQRRRKLGEQPDAGEYVDRIPEHDRWIREAIRIFGSAPPGVLNARQGVTPNPEGFPELVEYELIDKLGAGGMGIVYLARKRSRPDGGLVALKMIAEHALSRESIDQFHSEMKNQARLQHPHIVQVLDSGNHAGRPFFTMTYCRGFDLAGVLKDHGPLEPTMSAMYVSRVAWAVQYLHAQSEPLVHGDLKPKNILLDHHNDVNFPFGRPQLADFGLVALLQKVSAGIAQGSPIGTAHYMSPEQVEGGAGVGPASDVWGLGVILFECLTGKTPFQGETRAEIYHEIVHREPASPRAIRPNVPRDLQLICLKCLKKPLEGRYRSVSELVEDLACFLQKMPLVHARPEVLRDRVVQWTRRAPALVTRLAVIAACSAILWGYPLVTGRFAPLPPDHPAVTMVLRHFGLTHGDQTASAVLVWANQVTLIAWGVASWAFQRQLDRAQSDDGIQLGWRVADVVTLVLMIQFDDALMSPLTVAFAILIVASAFRARVVQIIQATLLSMTGYVVLVLVHVLSHPEADRHYRHFHYLVGLALLGVMLSYQAIRTQALMRMSGRS